MKANEREPKTRAKRVVPKTRSNRNLAWWGPVALMLAITGASGRTVAAPPGLDFFSADKLAHFLVFGLLATACFRALGGKFHPNARSLIAVLLVAGFGAVDEIHQSFTPGRSMEFDDWLADLAGAVVAVAVYRLWPAYHRILETPVAGKATARVGHQRKKAA